MPRKSLPVVLLESENIRLEQWIRAGSTPQQVVLRAKIILGAAQGQSDQHMARALKVQRRTAALWRRRFLEQGIGCVWEIAPGRGRKAFYGNAEVSRIIQATLQTKPKGSTHWSTRTLARAQGVSKNTIHRLWQEHQLKPHLTKSFKLSRDPKFLEKLTDVVGVYLTPPQNAVVLCVDEKSQIQALDRTQPGLPLKPGRCGTMTHDYKRNGTTTLFAALNILDGTVVGRCMPRHTHQEFIKFLNAVERAVPAGKLVHAIADNYATHKHPKVKAWLAEHPRWIFHFTPTSASWINAVEGFFSAITRKRIRRGVFTSVADLQDAIRRYIRLHNRDPKPFVWTKPADGILAKLSRLPASSD